jgi:hypothetical protein
MFYDQLRGIAHRASRTRASRRWRDTAHDGARPRGVPASRPIPPVHGRDALSARFGARHTRTLTTRAGRAPPRRCGGMPLLRRLQRSRHRSRARCVITHSAKGLTESARVAVPGAERAHPTLQVPNGQAHYGRESFQDDLDRVARSARLQPVVARRSMPAYRRARRVPRRASRVLSPAPSPGSAGILGASRTRATGSGALAGHPNALTCCPTSLALGQRLVPKLFERPGAAAQLASSGLLHCSQFRPHC